jgi:hypothetical protein
MERDRTFEQPQLLPSPERAGSRPAQPALRRRQAGLVGIARARAALAQAARRAEDRTRYEAA